VTVARGLLIASHALLIGAYLVAAGLAAYLVASLLETYLGTNPVTEPPRWLEVFLGIFSAVFAVILVGLAASTALGLRNWLRGKTELLRAIDGAVVVMVVVFPLLSLISALVGGGDVSSDAFPNVVLWSGLPALSGILAFTVRPPDRSAARPPTVIHEGDDMAATP
jgi:hypothetical protein